VREPFIFEVAHVVNSETPAQEFSSSGDCTFITKRLRSLSVASIVYQGSFPHQENSGFVEAWMSLVNSAPRMGYELTFRLYRELYHHQDWTDPSQSITEIQVEIRSRRARAMSA
jgi:effector-binding domain-containing protein